MEECGGVESCKEQFDKLELLDSAEDAAEAEVENLEACTQYVVLGRTSGGLLTAQHSSLSGEQGLKVKVQC